MVDANFYRVFGDRYRGSRELIKLRLAVYLPFILPLQQFFKTCPCIDLGCGRGEWLEFMQENGMDIQGVDLDQGMLEAARERGLKVNLGDAIQSLQSLESGSQLLASGFYLVEHLSLRFAKTIAVLCGAVKALHVPQPLTVARFVRKVFSLCFLQCKFQQPAR